MRELVTVLINIFRVIVYNDCMALVTGTSSNSRNGAVADIIADSRCAVGDVFFPVITIL